MTGREIENLILGNTIINDQLTDILKAIAERIVYLERKINERQESKGNQEGIEEG